MILENICGIAVRLISYKEEGCKIHFINHSKGFSVKLPCGKKNKALNEKFLITQKFLSRSNAIKIDFHTTIN